MKYALITATVKLLLLAVQCYQEQYHEVNLIRRLDDFFAFDHNIFLLDRTLDPDLYVATSQSSSICGNFTPQSVYTLENGSGENNTYVKSITSKDTLLIVAIENFNSTNSLKILAELERIANVTVRRSNVKIGVFLARKVTSTLTVEQLFRWSWSVGIVNIFCAFYSSVDVESSFNVFRFDPFGTFHLINITRSESLQYYFPNKIPNYRGYPFTFLKIRNVLGNDIEVKLWDAVVRVFNASKSTTYVLSYKDYLASEISADVIPHEEAKFSNLRTHPHRISKFMLLVPHARPYSGFLAYLQNATWNLLFAYTFIAIAGATLLLTVSGYLQTKKILVFQCIADVINLLMNDNLAIRYGQLHRADVCVIVPLTFTGLIVVNGILSVFRSYLTVPVYERQIKTIDDLFKSPVPILVNEINWVDIITELLENVTQHGGWSGKMRPASDVLIRKEVNKFNNSISLALIDYQIPWYLNAQKRLGIKAYHVISEPLLKSFATFQLKTNFPFKEPINDIIHRFQCAGLMDKWLKDTEERQTRFLWKYNTEDPDSKFKTSYESGSAEFTVPSFIWWGWIASAVVFACEIIWNKFESKLKPHIEKLKTKVSIN